MNLKKTSMMCLAASFFATALAKDSGSVIVTINGQQIIQNSQMGKEINDKLLAEKEKLSKPLQKDEQVILDKEQALQKNKKELDKEAAEITNSKLLSDEAKQRRIEELQEKARRLEEDRAELERLVKRIQADAKRLETKMSQMYNEEMGKFDATIKNTIKELSNKYGWDIVLMEESIVYAGPSASKTSIVIKELDGQSNSSSTAATIKKEIKADEQALKKLKA